MSSIRISSKPSNSHVSINQLFQKHLDQAVGQVDNECTKWVNNAANAANELKDACDIILQDARKKLKEESLKATSQLTNPSPYQLNEDEKKSKEEFGRNAKFKQPVSYNPQEYSPPRPFGSSFD